MTLLSTLTPPHLLFLSELALLQVGAADAEGRLTAEGRRMAALPLHPRMARMVLWGAARGPESARLACQIAAVLGGQDLVRGRDAPVDVRYRLNVLWGDQAASPLSGPSSGPLSGPLSGVEDKKTSGGSGSGSGSGAAGSVVRRCKLDPNLKAPVFKGSI